MSFARADLAAPPDRRRDRRSDGGAQGQSLPALLFSPNARVGDRSRSVAPAQPDPDDDARPTHCRRRSRRSPRVSVSTIAAAEDRARKFAWEIASDFSYPVVRAVRACCSSGCGGASTTASTSITADELAEGRAGQGARLSAQPSQPHRLSAAVVSRHAQGLAPPHIAAGANLNFPIVGPFLRRGGAFFLRRSFKGEPLYAAVFREYLHTMLAKGFPIAYFIEGGRSRSGRTLAPKGGLLGMTVRELHARASATAAAGSGVLQLRKAARGPHADRRARGTAEEGRVAGRASAALAAICGASTDACT